MKMLTVRQPYAWAIVRGRKREEYRSWSTAYRGVVLVHAAKAAEALGANELADLGVPAGAELVRGAVVGAVRLADVRPRKRGLGFAWVLAGRLALDPFPCQGNLGLARVPDGFRDSPQFARVCEHFGL